MFGHGKCPKCDQPVRHCDLDQIIVGDKAFGPFFHGVAMCCPNAKCHAVLGVSVDPLALAADIAQQVVGKLRGKTK